MSYKYRKKKYYKKRYYKKYDPYEDIAMVWALGIVLIWIFLIQVYKENPFIIWFGLWIVILALVIFTYFIYLKKKRRYLRVKTVKEMQELSWRDFEYFIEFLFKQNWFKAKVWKWRSDGGIDVTATKNWEKYLVQCKKWDKDSKIYKENKVWVQLLREFYGVMNMDSPTIKWVYITTSELTEPAKIEYEKIKDRLELWDYYTIEKHIEEFKIHKDTLFQVNEILCDKCGSKMVLRHAEKGSHKWEDFYGCSTFPECRHIKSL